MPPSLRSSNTRSFGHLSAIVEAGDALQHAAHGDADGERQRRELGRHAGELPADRQADAAAERRVPAPAAPAAARGLKLRDADVELADGRRRSQQMPVRRVELREHFELREPRRDVGLERRAQRFRVEQVEAARQAGNPTPGAASTVSPQSASLRDLLPDGRTGDAERARELLAGMRAAVGQGVQQTFGGHAVYWTAAQPARRRAREPRLGAVEHAADVAAVRIDQQRRRAAREQEQAALLGQRRDAEEHDRDERRADRREPDEARREHDQQP